MMKAIFCYILVIFSLVYANEERSLSSEEFINKINNAQSHWTAGKNLVSGMPKEIFQRMLGVVRQPNTGYNYRQIEKVEDVPEFFDARKQWPNCTSIREIACQSACGSCWAVSTASAMSDRLCIASKQQNQVRVSAKDLMSCCDEGCGNGCHGGEPLPAWQYWETDGITTGGLYNSSEGCQPYSFPPCANMHPSKKYPVCSKEYYETPDCSKKCDTSEDYVLTYGQNSTSIKGEEDIKQHILQHGPVVCTFTVYEDFRYYMSGVYTYTQGFLCGRHAVRVIGWGAEQETKYWLVANSWNDEWGEEGLFKIKRGNNECGFEERCSAGLPKL